VSETVSLVEVLLVSVALIAGYVLGIHGEKKRSRRICRMCSAMCQKCLSLCRKCTRLKAQEEK
jgi:hypothetical protein